MAIYLSILGCLATAPVMAEALIKETMDINVQEMCPSMQGLPEDKKSVKGFSHAAHANKYLKGNAKYAGSSFEDTFTCKACHGSYETSEEICNESVSGRCKSLAKKLDAAGGPQKLKAVFHDMCLKCHKNMKKDGKKTGPVKCNECHKKNK